MNDDNKKGVMKSQIKSYFDRRTNELYPDIYQNLIVEYEQIVRSNTVIEMLSSSPGDFILDIGCGKGRDLMQLAKFGTRVIGIDFSDKMIEEAKIKISEENIRGIQLIVGDATNLPFPNKVFDKVLASEVIEHIPDYTKAILEMIRVVKRRGSIVITTPNRHSFYGFDRYIIFEKFFKKSWPHAYDEWKTFEEVTSVLKDNRVEVVAFLGICYVPGFIVTYRLPKGVQRLILKLIANLEPRLSRLFPKNGYMLCFKAMK